MCQFCPSARQTLVTVLGGLGAISCLVNIWFVKPRLNGLNSASPLSTVHIELTHSTSYSHNHMHGVSEEKSRLTSFSLWIGNIKLFSIMSFSFLFLFLSLFQSFSRLFMTCSSVSFLVFLLLFNRSASVLWSNSFRSPSVPSPASSASDEFTGKFTVYLSSRYRFHMGLWTLRSIWTTIHW